MSDLIYLLDLVGTFGFSLYGARKAILAEYDFLGVFICAFLTGCGGGTVRDFLLADKIPIYLYDIAYPLVVLLSMLTAYIFFKRFNKISKIVQFADSLGLVIFSYIGINLAIAAELNLFGMISFALISSCFGGFLRDLALNQKPELLYKDFYGMIPVFMAVLIFMFPLILSNNFSLFGFLFLMLVIRYLVIWKNFELKDIQNKFLS